uniref:MGAT4 conserved region domain-containing protein n=1 Tax=Ursus americanus TaxID=9643 RepID=A0A452RUI1_URSAM
RTLAWALWFWEQFCKYPGDHPRAHTSIFELLTIGISSVQHPRGSYLLDTLQSLFFASSSSEQKHFIVVVHLADPDPKWLGQMISSISTLFKPYIQARQLIVINTPLKSYLPLKDLKKNLHDSPAYVAFSSKQNMDYAFLMNFATNHSDYFLMIEDDVKCAPGFVTQIVTIVSAWENKSWLTLNFSQLGFTGKLFRTRDLPCLVHFLFLFYQEMPCDYLLAHFHDLLIPSVFYHMGNYSVFEDTCFPVEKEKVFGEPDNPVANVLTDMMAGLNVIPQYAYILNKECYSVLDPVEGNYLTVILEKPQKVIRIEVLTGSDKQGLYWLQQGQVELGYDPLENSRGCTRYTLLGPLVEGHLDQRVFYEEDSVEELSCIRLIVLASQKSWLLVRQIRVWTQPEEEKIGNDNMEKDITD